MSEVDRMAVIRQHLDRVTVPECKAQAVCVNGRHCIDAGCCLRSGEVAVVPASQLAGAVAALESIRDRLEPFVKGGEPAAEDAVDIYEIADHALNHPGGQS